MVHKEYTPRGNWTVATIKSAVPRPSKSEQSHQAQPYFVRAIDDMMPKVNGPTHFCILDGRSSFSKST